MIRLKLDLTERQYYQLLQSLENDQSGNNTQSFNVIERIIEKIKKGRQY
jgi:hypothetical protein